jgi:hypothetical protein
MLSQREESATPRADKPVRAGAVDRPCLRVEPWLDDLIDEVGHDHDRSTSRPSGSLCPASRHRNVRVSAPPAAPADPGK